MALRTSRKFDDKWKKKDLRRIFSEEGLQDLWSELKADNELQPAVPRSVSMTTTSQSNTDPNAAEGEGRGGGGGDANSGGGGGGGGKEVDEIASRQKNSPFFTILAEWTWGQETTNDHLREAVRCLSAEQQEIALRAACCTFSLSKLNKRLIIFERLLVALSRKEGEEEEAAATVAVVDEGGEEEMERREKMDREREERESDEEESTPAPAATTVTVEPKQVPPPTPPPPARLAESAGSLQISSSSTSTSSPAVSSSQVSDGFARIGARTALSFAFSFLRRAWQTEGDDSLCNQVFDEAREILQELPVGLMFDSRHISQVWIEVVDRIMTFLTGVSQGSSRGGEVGVPQSSRHAALSLLLELCLHRAKLHQLLDVVFLLLQLSGSKVEEEEEEEEEVRVGGGVKREPGEEVKKRRVEEEGKETADSGGAEFPLVPFLRRLNQISIPPRLHSKPPTTATEQLHSSAVTSNPIKSFLEYFTLPNDESTSLDPALVATVTLSRLDQLASPYYSVDQSGDGEEEELPNEVFHLGGDWASASSLSNPRSIPVFSDLRVKSIAATDKELFVLSADGAVHKLTPTSKQRPSHTHNPVLFPAGMKIEQLSLHPDGRHFLALSRGGEVFSWGSGDNGRLGLGDTRSRPSPMMVDGLRGKKVVTVATGGDHSAAVTDDGGLYTWGKGSHGRLGHGNIEDKLVPTQVKGLSGHKIVAVGCGSDDAHTIALEENGSVWSWGDGESGKLGRGGSDVAKTPKLIPGLEGVKKIVCGSQFTLALTASGNIYSWGSGETYQMGNGKMDPVRKPCLMESLSGHRVIQLAAGSHHCLALTEQGEVLGWGADVERERGGGGGGGEERCVAVPKVLSEVSKSGAVYISCGARESFVCCQPKPKAVSVGTQLPFAVDVRRATFEQLDRLLHRVCRGLGGRGGGVGGGALSQPHHESECMAVAALNLLRLQFHVARTEGVPPATLGLQPGSSLLSSIKRRVVELARSSSVIESIQTAAQAALRTGWSLLLPTVSERASTLSQLLPAQDSSLETESSLPAGQQFMINLLVDSLMADRGLEDALTIAIAAEVKDGRPVSLYQGGGGGGGGRGGGGEVESAVPLLHLVRQLLGNATARQLSAIKKLSEREKEEKEEMEVKGGNKPPVNEYSSAVELLTLFQRLLLSIIYCHIPSIPGQTGTETHRADTQVQGALLVLSKYITMLHEHICHIMPTVLHVAQISPQHLRDVGGVLCRGPLGVVLPEISLGLLVLQIHMPLLLQDSRCVSLVGDLIRQLDGLNQLHPLSAEVDEEDLAWPGVRRPSTSGRPQVVTREDFDVHNEAGGAWTIIGGKVYDLEMAERSCGAERLMEFAGKDATKEFEGVEHSESAMTLISHCLVGKYSGEGTSQSSERSTPPSPARGLSPVLVDTERTLAVLQGLRASHMVHSLPVSPEEEECEKWLSSDIFFGGFEPRPFTSSDDLCDGEGLGGGQRKGVVFSRQVSLDNHSFIAGFLNPDLQDERVTIFVSLVQRYCRHRHLIIPHTDSTPDHPVERFGRLYLACFIKLHDLVPVALRAIEQETNSPNNELDPSMIHLPPSLVDVCKVVFDTKIQLVKARQESSCSYDEVCRDPIARCLFILDNVRSPLVNVNNILHRTRIQGTSCRWRQLTHKIIKQNRERGKVGADKKEDPSLRSETVGEGEEGEGSLPKERTLVRSSSLLPDPETTNTWDQVNMEIMRGKKFKWLRDRMGGGLSQSTQLLGQIKNFVLTEELDVKFLHSTVKKQMDRALLRQEGVRYLLEVVKQDSLLPSVQYAVLCGWLGLTSPGQCLSKLHYLNGVEHVPPSLRTNLELDQQRVQQWVVGRLRRAVWDIQLNLSREKTQARKMEGEREREQGAAGVDGSNYTVGAFSASRFVIVTMAMLTGEHEAVDLSLLLNEGVVGLAQTALHLGASVHKDKGVVAEEEESSVVGVASHAQNVELTGPEALARMKMGTRVVRGKDWKWGDQDGPGEGTVIKDPGGDGWVRVKWEIGAVNSYRMGENDHYDLSLAPSELQPKTKDGDTKNDAENADISVCVSKPLQGPDLPSRLLLDSVVCLLRSLVVGMALHCQSLNSRHTRSVSSLLHYLLQSGAGTTSDEKGQSKVATIQHDSWVTLGFLRGVTSPPHSSAVFCTPHWIQLLLGLVENALPSVSRQKQPSYPLVKQVLTLRLLRAILPAWEVGKDETQQKSLVDRLFRLLGRVLVLCSSPFILPSKTERSRKNRKVRLHASLTASSSSTVAEEIVVLIRRLHPLKSWNGLINGYIREHLRRIPDLIATIPTTLPPDSSDSQIDEKALQADVDIYGPVLAILMVIGGMDTRPRLGGLVQHEELGSGTVVKIEAKSKVVVLFHGRKAVKSCNIAAVKAVPVLGFRVDQLPMSETVMGVWTSLVRLSGPGGRGAAAVVSATPAHPSSAATNIKTLTPMIPIQKKFPSDETTLDIPLLRQQQIRLGLLKAAHVLFSQQENLRQIMSRPTDSEDGQFSLFQQLLSAATRPSPIKAMFSRHELEVAAVSVCQYLASEVHKPLTPPQTTPTIQTTPTSSKSKSKKTHSSNSTAHSSAAGKATPTGKARAKPAPELPPPSPLVSQIMEMGFPRHHIEKAIEVSRVTGSAERLIAWLLDPTNRLLIEQADEKLKADQQGHEAPGSGGTEGRGGGGGGSGSGSGGGGGEKKVREEKKRNEGVSSSESSEASEDENEIPDQLPIPEPGQKSYKKPQDFASTDDYARYVRDNLREGMLVKCINDYEEVKKGDVGRVTKLDNDGLNDLNIQCFWHGKGAHYWVRYANVEILGHAQQAPAAPTSSSSSSSSSSSLPVATNFKPGDKVRVKSSVHTPKYKWGSINHQSVGVVQTLNRNGIDVTVNFSEQSNWTGVISEMELVPGSHPRHSCNGCRMNPIDGPRYHCQVCSAFDFCQSCFDQGQSHNHAFERIDDQGQQAVYVGSPHSRQKALKRKRKKAMRGGSVVMEWEQIVKHLTVSSNESQAHRLTDSSHTTFWQSSGPQGKHWVQLEMQRNILIEQLSIQVEPSDSSYMPSLVEVKVGHTVGGLKELKKVSIPSSSREAVLLTGMTEFYPLVMLQIRACKSGGIDTRVRGVSIIGRVNMNEDEIAAHFSFLTVEEAAKDPGLVRQKRRREHETPDAHANKAFVWGLNDKGQLGSEPEEEKVKTPIESRTLAKLRPIQFVGGAKTLFIISQDGKVYSCGEGATGKLGVGDYSDQPLPRVLSELSTYVVRKVATSCGGRHAMALTADGKVFSWGDGELGQLGHGDNQSYNTPKMVEGLQGKHVRDIACGSDYSAAITSNGELYTWGRGHRGQLGHGDCSNTNKPKQVRELERHRVVGVACGLRLPHTLAVTDTGTLWSWGDGAFGKLGIERTQYAHTPQKVQFGEHQGVSQIHCGVHFSLVLTKDGSVYTWGKGDYFRLGSDASTIIKFPHKVEGLTNKKVIDVAVGAMHCLALTESGEIFSWGDNDHGQMGNGTVTANRKPQLITAIKDHRITKIACGSSHCVAFAAGTPATTGEFSPVSFPASQDPLGSSLLVGKTDEEGGIGDEAKRPSLTKIILSLTTPAKQQEALGHMQTALQITYARDAIVNSMGGVALAAQETGDDMEKEEGTSAVEITGVIPSTDVSSITGFSSTTKPSDELEVPLSPSPEKLIPNFPYLARDLMNFTHLLTVEDARVMVDLLKLAVARRLGVRGKETLGAVLTAMAKTNNEVALMLTELCINELEEVARSPRISETPQPILQESPHPYIDNCSYGNNILMPGAEALILTFDPRCSTERRHDVLVIKDGSGAVIAVKSGRDTADWAQDIRVVGDELSWTFKSDGSVNGWGFRFTVNPILPKKVHGGSELSDRVLQSRPSIDLVTCLLDFQLGRTPTQESISRLGAALASCAQLSTLGSSQRMWAIQHFRKLLNSPTSGFLVSGAMGSCCPVKEAGEGSISPLLSLVRSLPDALLKQFNYEIAHVTGGNQLQHSSFLQSLVLLGCDLELDRMESCSDSTKWTWFTQFCVAARMARAIQNRTVIPACCLTEVEPNVESLTQPNETPNKDHEDHQLFQLEHDEQLLLWMQRYPKEWVIPLGIAFSVYGWGHNHRGQLGGVEGNKIKTPRLCEAFSELSPVKVIGGEQTMFAITKDGKVYASGYGAYGRLGIGGVDSVSSPTLITSLATRGIVVTKIACHSGGKHCLALTNNGEIYSWGEGDDGKLGHGGTANVDTPRFIEAMKGQRVVNVECGSSHSACILDDGALYTWGKGRYGRLGHNDYETQYKPKQVIALKGEKIVVVACGSGDAHSLAASTETVFSWGDGDYGKLGHGGNEGSKVPKKVESLSGKGVVKLMCGSQFSVALTKNGHIYTWGKGDYYRLGHADDSHQRLPRRVMGPLSNKKVIDIACGSLHCVCCTSEGDVYTWGDNDEGQIGNDSVTPVQGPQRIPMPDGVHIDHVSCGSAHTICWSLIRRKLVCTLPKRVPLEFNHLKDVPMPVLRNRLILLHHFSNLFCKSLSLFSLQTRHSELVVGGVVGVVSEGAFVEGFDGLRGVLVSSSKETAFRRVIKATMTQGKQHGPVIELNRIQVKRSRGRGKLAGPDGLNSVFGQMCSKWSILSQEDLLLPHRVWKVKFVGESVDDCGGGYSESIAEMCDELQNGSVPLLIQTPNGRDDTGVNRDCFIVNPASNSTLHLNMFRFLGVLMGIAVRSGSPINLSLAPPAWKQLVGLPLTISDLSEVDNDYVQGLLYVRDNPDSFVGTIEFTAPDANGHAVRLHPTWTHITLDNHQEYFKLSLYMRLHEFDQQVVAIREGMSRVVPLPLLSLFTGPELETMVCGSREISIELLKSVTTYKGIDATAPLIRWFWEVMESFSQTERSLFLRFVWGRTRLPRTASDFRGRDFVLQVLDKYQPPDYYLPESYTCFFLLKVPRYSCKPVLEEKLRYAINFCKSIDTDDYARVNLQEGMGLDGDDDYSTLP